VIELRGLGKRYGGVVAVTDVSLEVADRELVVLLGASGCGKTTTLKMVNRLIEPDTGTVRIDGEDAAALPPHELRRRIGYAFQGVGLFPHLSVAENVGITPSLLGWDGARIARRVDEMLALVELDPSAVRSRRPSELSGGQQQRVGVARALAASPRVVLMDEPFGALDPLTRARVQESFLRLRRELGLTGLFVTHDVPEALRLGDRIGVVEAGRLVQVGTAAELRRAPATEHVRELMESPRTQARELRAVIGEDP
jgi:osmoprotectant transport system ATP-binding protein